MTALYLWLTLAPYYSKGQAPYYSKGKVPGWVGEVVPGGEGGIVIWRINELINKEGDSFLLFPRNYLYH